MTMADATIMIDPAVVVPCQYDDLLDFWDNFISWTEDRRVSLGVHSYGYIVDWCTDTIWAQKMDLLPKHLMRDIERCINQLLARTPIDHDTSLSCYDTDPQHISVLPGLSDSFISDVVGCSSNQSINGIASHLRYWSVPQKAVDICQGNFRTEIIYSTDENLNFDIVSKVKKFYFGSKIYIVGGKRSDIVLKDLFDRLGIGSENIEWFESEFSKPPRELDRKLKSFDGNTDHLVFIYGRIDHASFAHVQVAVQRSGYLLIQPQYESQIVGKMYDRAVEAF